LKEIYQSLLTQKDIIFCLLFTISPAQYLPVKKDFDLNKNGTDFS
jgi:hypothetical protein